MNIKNKLKIISISDIKPYKNNAVIHSPEQVQILKKSLADNDYIEPIIVGTNNICIGGHGRLLALNEIDPKQKIEVVDVSYLKPKQQKKLRILLNKSASQEYDKDLLQAEIESIYKGFDDIDKIADELSISDKEINSLVPTPETEGDDDIPEKAPAITKLGDLWELGRHRLLCGDSTKEDDVNRLMNGKKADMVFTDPPYGIGYEYNSHKDTKGKEYLDFCDKWFLNLKKYCDKYIVITTGWGYQGYWWNKNPKDCLHWLCRNKQTGGTVFHFRRVEPIFVWGKPYKKYDFDFFEELTNRLDGLREKHTCPKPVQFIINLIEKGCNYNHYVLDVFCGSGTTLIACEKINRICYGMELDPVYCDVIVQRYIDFCIKNDINIEIKHNGKKFNTEITR
jgi:DNA modification methylase